MILSRTGYNGDAPAGQTTVTAGTVRIANDQATIGRVTYRRRTLVENGKAQTLTIPVERSPIRVVIEIANTFRAGSDPRDLGAQVGFRFVPQR